ncbi:family 16 glycosylhydrolase [Pseudoroseomonas wenyumeiae]
MQDRKVAAAEVYTCQRLGFGTYEASVMVPALNGMVSAMMSYVDGSQTEIDFEFEGRDPGALHAVTWTSQSTKEHSLHVSVAAFPGSWTKLKYEWKPTGSSSLSMMWWSHITVMLCLSHPHT